MPTDPRFFFTCDSKHTYLFLWPYIDSIEKIWQKSLVRINFHWQWATGPLLKSMTTITTAPLFQLYCGGQFYWWKKPEYPERTTDLSQATDKFYHIMLHLSISRIRTHNVSGDNHWNSLHHLVSHQISQPVN